jgi:hypothetical protein
VPLDNPSLMRNRKRRSIRRESRWRNQSRLKIQRNMSRRRIERDVIKRKICAPTCHPLILSWQGFWGGTRGNTFTQGRMTLSTDNKVIFLSFAFIYCIS